ncbi:MAG: hypothetical protein IPH60_05200 [Flavobacteriales bacterium]|nr:hypothetical protein [Flavobacteriales bacterium]
MKTKLTLSIDRRKVAKLRKASARRSTSISELVENMADKLDEAPVEDTEANILKWAGSLELPPRLSKKTAGGAELRKTKYYARMKKADRKRA